MASDLTSDSEEDITKPGIAYDPNDTVNRAGCLLAELPEYCSSPPIEVVVFGWGVTEDGQLALDERTDVNRPSVIESLLGTSFSGFGFNRKPIVPGSRQTLAVTASGRVLSWGWNDRGTLGLGHRRSTTKPAMVKNMEQEHVVQVAAGGWHSLAVTKHGKMYAWGGNEYFQCGVDEGKRDICVPKQTVPDLTVRMVACAGMQSTALTTSGDVWQWGEPWGDFSMEVNRAPRKLAVSGVESICSGAFHHLALDNKSRVHAWGTNDFGQLGTGDTAYCTEPKLVVDLEDVKVADIGAGGWHSLALSDRGEVFTWGRGEYGRLGLGDPKGASHVRPSRVPGLEGHVVIQAACGGSHTMVLTDKGKMFTWGRVSNGRQGFETDATVETPHPIKLPGGAERWHPICIAAGGRHSMCLALPRHTINDHERRLTLQSSEGSASRLNSMRMDRLMGRGASSDFGDPVSRTYTRETSDSELSPLRPHASSLLARSLATSEQAQALFDQVHNNPHAAFSNTVSIPPTTAFQRPSTTGGYSSAGGTPQGPSMTGRDPSGRGVTDDTIDSPMAMTDGELTDAHDDGDDRHRTGSAATLAPVLIRGGGAGEPALDTQVGASFASSISFQAGAETGAETPRLRDASGSAFAQDGVPQEGDSVGRMDTEADADADADDNGEGAVVDGALEDAADSAEDDGTGNSMGEGAGDGDVAQVEGGAGEGGRRGGQGSPSRPQEGKGGKRRSGKRGTGSESRRRSLMRSMPSGDVDHRPEGPVGDSDVDESDNLAMMPRSMHNLAHS